MIYFKTLLLIMILSVRKNKYVLFFIFVFILTKILQFYSALQAILNYDYLRNASQ